MGRNTVDFCLQTRGLEYICYNHSYFFFSEECEHSAWRISLAPFCNRHYRVTGPCLERRKGTPYCTANTSSKTGQGAKGRVQKRKEEKKNIAIKKVSKIWVHCMSKGRMREWRQPPRMKTLVPSISWHTYGLYVTLPNLFHLFCCHLCYCDPQVAVSPFSWQRKWQSCWEPECTKACWVPLFFTGICG